MKFDEIYRPVGVCIKVGCRSDIVLDLNYCQIANPSDGCELVNQDLTKEYPHCCEKLKCGDVTKEVTRE